MSLPTTAPTAAQEWMVTRMDEYIRREEAIDAVLDAYFNTPKINLIGKLFYNAILELQPADVAPIRHGRWKCTKPCPVCGEDRFKGLDADIWADWEPPYCPNCGAKMDGE